MLVEAKELRRMRSAGTTGEELKALLVEAKELRRMRSARGLLERS